MQNCTDLNLCEGVCIFTPFHFPDSCLYLLNVIIIIIIIIIIFDDDVTVTHLHATILSEEVSLPKF